MSAISFLSQCLFHCRKVIERDNDRVLHLFGQDASIFGHSASMVVQGEQRCDVPVILSLEQKDFSSVRGKPREKEQLAVGLARRNRELPFRLAISSLELLGDQD
jgi:hypothetical protein